MPNLQKNDTDMNFRESIGGTSADKNDRRFQISVAIAMAMHVLVIVVIPLAMGWGCQEEPYGIPLGMGLQQVQIIEVKRVKKENRVIFNMDSPISYYDPEIDDSRLEELDKDTDDEYQATQKSGLGEGGAGKGGWPNGMKDARVGFIRLEYSGGDWDQDMGVDADYNLLLKFKELHGQFNITSDTEHRPIKQLRRYPKGRAPPFVFITGRGGISVSSADIKTLRWYCLEEGGMIFADNGGGSFDRNFRSLMSRVLPRLRWVDIPSDDIIFSQPYAFPDGAPPLWHHSGTRAMGLKHNGRWVTFYHQGDLNDAWKTGHSGASKALADQAYKLGINIMNYSFTKYINRHYGK